MSWPASPSPRRRRTARRRRTLAVAVAVVSIGVGLAGCGEDQTGEPGVPDVDFTPTMVATVDGGTISMELGAGAEDEPTASIDPAGMPVPGVLLVRFEGQGDQRIVGHLIPPGEEPPDLGDPDVATPAPLFDSGIQRDGDEVTVVLTAPGTLELSPIDDRAAAVAVELTGE